MRGVLLRKFSHLSRNLNCNNYIAENAPFRDCFPSRIRLSSSGNGSPSPESNPESETSVVQTEDKKTVTAWLEDVDNKDEVKRKGEKKFNEIGDRVEKGELEVEQGQKFEDQMVLERAKLITLEGSPQFDNNVVPNNKKEPDEPLGGGPILRWQTRVVFAPGGDAWYPKNRKVKLAVTVKEPGLSKHQFLRLRELAGKLYNPRKDQHTITSERNISSICTAKFEPPIQEEDHVWVLCTRSTFLQIQQTLIQQCAKQRALKQGKSLHAQIIHFGLQSDTLISNMLINLFSKCGVVDYSHKVFDKMRVRSLVSWNTMIGAYTQNRNGEEALKLFVRMLRDGSEFSEFALSSVLCACASKTLAFESKQLHSFAVKKSMESNAFVGTALLDVYAKCRYVDDAFRVFESMPEKSDVTWSSMMAGLVQNELYEEALSLFLVAQRTNVEISMFVMSSVLSACAALAALIEGKQVHAMVHKTGFVANEYIASSLVDVYAKCGSIKESHAVFCEAEEKNIVLWNTMISGFARHAKSLEAMILFEKMQQMFLYPNEVTYVSILSACAHMGLVQKGKEYFDMMQKDHDLTPNVFHYSCMVDILGRTGRINEAKELIDKMPFEATASMWGSLLASCRVYRNVEVAEVAAKKLFEIEPNNAGNHVLLSNIYASNGRWEDVALARKLLNSSEAKKERGKSWIEIKNKVHSFMVGERSHPRIGEIYSRLDKLVKEMEELGFKGHIEHDLHDVEDDCKKELLKHHSEKLAFTFGLMCLPSCAPIRIMKNLRICGDCHEFMKVASSVTRREIIVRDNNRFHHFREGYCSCGEFW